MPAPVVAVLGSVFAALGPWIMRFFAAKAVLMVAGFLGRVGLVLATNEVIVQPLIDHAIQMWNGIPGAWQCWLALFGVTKAAGIYVSGLSLIAAKKIFLAKSE
ncbi:MULTISPECIES: hypothetical protein [unclassified Pseudoxanthomonas]|uniref:hypothetical protein n=1 Tax=unclassified Pseudoxanthomonas TaxID=2645906 RepID=UPI00307DB3A7